MPSNIPLWTWGAALRLRLVTFTEHAHRAYRPLGGILAWRRGHLSTLWHGDPQQNHFWGRVTWQDCLDPVSNRSLADASAGLRHGIPDERPLGGIPAWRGSHLSALRHGDPFHKHLSGILAWRGGLLSTLWHGDPQQNYFWGRVTWQDCLDPVSNRSLADASAGL